MITVSSYYYVIPRHTLGVLGTQCDSQRDTHIYPVVGHSETDWTEGDSSILESLRLSLSASISIKALLLSIKALYLCQLSDRGRLCLYRGKLQSLSVSISIALLLSIKALCLAQLSDPRVSLSLFNASLRECDYLVCSSRYVCVREYAYIPTTICCLCPSPRVRLAYTGTYTPTTVNYHCKCVPQTECACIP